MIHSMTAFARRETKAPWGQLSWELRSVNHRYLDVGLRLPEELRALEPAVRETVGRYLQRGKVECGLRLQLNPAAGGLSVNTELARRLAHTSREIDSLLYNPAPVSSIEIMRWPGVLQVETPDPEQVSASALSLLEEALSEMVATRAREGARLAALLVQRLDAIADIATQVRARVPQVLDAYRDRLTARLEELRGQLDEPRLEQELLLVAQRADVAEELDRLDTHIREGRRVLEQGGAVGRRLDFLMQEFHREANTLSAKSLDSEVTRAAVELKVLIEQMREQVQNIE